MEAEDEWTALGICLEKDAEEAFDSMRADNADITIEEVKAALKLRYDEDHNEISLRSKIAKRKLKKGESVSEYYNEIRRWSNKI